ncbi:hypothetical protein M407DRAFT_9755 [Tulasnella calospora MUT 4182]|uniref:IBB domain-containing protein n=1 Tax=Tulasnella calospora MUT 4182 TaxID=1051891 RepID=A0A0C3LNA6_9AGAM|nr:hypothetical protein M407DRAFT_9755 [Tulasnella calospora MUT 4182]
MSQQEDDSHSTDYILEEWVDVPENLGLTVPRHVMKNLFSSDLHILHQSFPPILSMLEAGLVPRLLDMLDVPSVPIQLEVVWILARLASGPPEPVHVMVSRGAVPKLANVMASSTCDEVRDIAAWALGNILGHESICYKLRLGGGFGSYWLSGARSRTLLRSIFWAYDRLKPYMSVESHAVRTSVATWIDLLDVQAQRELQSRLL